MTEQQREAFEKWAESEGLNTVWGHTGYLLADTAAAWKAWQVNLSHAEGEAVPVGYLSVLSDGTRIVDARQQYDAPEVWPIYTHPAPQVAGLTETAIKSSPAYRALHREKDHLLGLLKDQAPQVAVPEPVGWVKWFDGEASFQPRDAILPEDAKQHGWQLVGLMRSLNAPTAPAGELVTRCTAGLGCDEKGYCDAAATGQGDLCDRRTMAHEQPVSDPDGFEQVLEELRKLHTEMTNTDLVHEGGPEIVGYCVTGKQLDRMEWLLTCCASAALSAPAPDEREIAAKALSDFADRMGAKHGDTENGQFFIDCAEQAHEEATRLRAAAAMAEGGEHE